MNDYLVLGLLALNAFLTVWSLRQMSFAVARAVEDLDGRMAGAIQSVLSGDLSIPEPINPIQQAIASMLTNNLNKRPIDQIRNADGTFSPLERS
jgi:hypothetical protein